MFISLTVNYQTDYVVLLVFILFTVICFITVCIQLIVRWQGHFENKEHHEGKLLNEIEPHNPQSDILLEDARGQPPLTRSREAIPNVNGIVSYEMSVFLSDPSIEDCEKPTVWTNVSDFLVIHLPTYCSRMYQVYEDTIRYMTITGMPNNIHYLYFNLKEMYNIL